MSSDPTNQNNDAAASNAAEQEPYAFDFRETFKRELEAVAFRRKTLSEQRAAAQPAMAKSKAARTAPPHFDALALHTAPMVALPLFDAATVVVEGGEQPSTPPAQKSPSPGKGLPSAENRGVPLAATSPTKPWQTGDPLKGADCLNLTGLCLSGGGIRSAAVCMGVLQGLDSLSPRGTSHVIDRLDYLSTVSGGNYTGTSVASGMMQCDGTFPFESKTDDAETPETQHVRDYSSFLIPNGLSDILSNVMVVLRGLLANAVMVLPVLLSLALLTILSYPQQASLPPAALGHFVVTPIALGLLALLMIAWTALRKWMRRDGKPYLSSRETWSARAGCGLLGLGFIALLEWQPAILRAMFQAAPGQPPPAGADGIAAGVAWLFNAFGNAGYVLGPAALALLAFAQKLANIAHASFGDASRTGAAKRILSKVGLFALGLSLPLLLWVVYLNLSYWGIATGASATNAHAPALLQALGDWLPHPFPRLSPVAQAYLWLVVLAGGTALLFGPNANSLNQLYRDRLSRAFLMERTKVRDGQVSDGVDSWRFSSLKAKADTGQFDVGAAYAPYLLVNTAINLQGAKLLNRRGRNADVFTLAPLASGSDATGYVPTRGLEQADPRLTLATGMAISGAAASANMGGNTIPVLTFSLAMLNIRLGYWLANPKRMRAEPAIATREKGLGVCRFARELFGRIREDSAQVYLTDGGHIENLGLYELLKRRCRVIIAVDSEADQGMVFPSLVRVQMLARIDHGVRIELPWPKIAAATRNANAVMGKPEEASLAACSGPHVAVGRILYRKRDDDGTGEDVHGVLIYLKSSLSGDENDIIRDYKRRYGAFPHETTLDQFFSEEQFEVYRALGFHLARGFFTGNHEVAFADFGSAAANAAFAGEIENALKSIAVPEAMIRAILARQQAATAPTANSAPIVATAASPPPPPQAAGESRKLTAKTPRSRRAE